MRRRDRSHDDVGRASDECAAPQAPPSTQIARVLALQRAAGNRQVADLRQRSGSAPRLQGVNVEGNAEWTGQRPHPDYEFNFPGDAKNAPKPATKDYEPEWDAVLASARKPLVVVARPRRRRGRRARRHLRSSSATAQNRAFARCAAEPAARCWSLLRSASIPGGSVVAPRARPAAAAVAIAASMAVMAPVAAFGAPPDAPVDARVRIDPREVDGGDIAGHFVGVSIEWTLTDRYMGPNSRPGFANLLRNFGSGVLRIGGSSQDQVPFDATMPDSDRYITPHDLARIRAALDLVDSGEPGTPEWVTVLGTAMAPPTATFPWRSVDKAAAFARGGVASAFGDDAGRRKVAGISLGNEPDLTYSGDLARYLGEFPAYANAEAVNEWPRVMPATSENIGSWQDFKQPPTGFNTRWFWSWPAILDAVAPTLKDRPGPLEPAATDHFYPMARACSVNTPYRCPSIERLLDQARMDNFSFQVYTHANQAADRGLRYRMDETNTAAGRGAPGVSDVAASATWTLETLFNAACPQPPDQPGANADCHIGATGVNFHNAEVNAYFRPEEGNAYYNAIRYDPTPAAGAPTPGPSYYALLLFARFAQGTTGLRPVTVDGAVPVRAWEVRASRSERRLFLINKGATPVTVDVRAPAARVDLNRMTPYDPTGAGRTLDAPDVRVDGQAVAPDGTFPGVAPTMVGTHGGHLPVAIAPGEAIVVTLHDH